VKLRRALARPAGVVAAYAVVTLVWLAACTLWPDTGVPGGHRIWKDALFGLASLGFVYGVISGRIMRERRQVHAIRHAPVAIFACRLRTGATPEWLYVSPALEDVLGIRAGTLSRDFSALAARIHAADRPEFDRGMELAARDGAPWRAELRFEHPGLGEIWVEIYGTPRTDVQGLVWYGTLRDITRRKRVENALEESEANLRSYMEHSPFAVLVVDGTGRYLEVNRAAEELAGYSREELLAGMGHRDLVDPEDLARCYAEFEDLRAGRRLDSEYRMRDRNGVRRWVSVRAVQLGGDRYMGYLHDITSRKSLEAAIAERLNTQDYLVKVAASTPATIYAYRVRPDGSSCLPYASPNIHDIYGLRPEELAADCSAIYSLIHPADIVRVQTSIAESARTLEPWHAEYRVVNPEKGERWVDGYSIPHREPDGSVMWHGFFHDITARKHGEQALHESEARANLIFDTHPDAMLVVDANDRIVRANSRAEELFGYPLSELVGMPVEPLIPARYRQRHHARTQGYRREPATRAVVYQQGIWALHRDGTEFPVEISLGMVELGGERHVIATIHDITTRRQAELQLRRYGQIFEVSRDMLAFLDHEQRFLVANPACAAIFGRGSSELEGRTLTEIASDELQAQMAPSFARTLGGEEQKFDVSCRAADGAPRMLECHSLPFWRDQQVAGIVVTFHDITAQRAAAAARETALAEATRLAQLRSEFLAKMSHEIRTPLNAVLGLAQLGLRRSSGRKSQETFKRIVDAGHHLLGVIDDILDFSKIEANKLELADEPIVAGELIDRAVDLVAERAYATGVALVISEAPDLPSCFRGDGARLAQVLVNLLMNAIKFTPAGGRVELAAGQDGGTLVLAVIDTGIGIQPSEMPRIFLPFEQESGTTTARSYGGAGLGLAISKQLMDRMGGEIRVDSAPGRGSRFEIRLPLREAGPPSAPQLPGPIVLVGFEAGEALGMISQLAAFGIAGAALGTPDELPALGVLCIAGEALADEQWVRTVRAALGRGQRVLSLFAPGTENLPRDLRDRLLLLEKPFRPRHLARAAIAPLPNPREWPAGEDRRLADYSILAAEDNADNRLVLTELLESEGARVHCVENGREALEVLHERGFEAFDIVVTDIQMPEMDGYETARRIRSAAPGLPVLGLTAYALPEERDRCFAAGMVEHIPKPIDVDALIGAILHHAPPRTHRGAQEPLVDWAAVMQRYGGREAFIDKLVATVVATYAGTSAELREAAGMADAAGVARAAHGVKGMSGNLSATAVMELATRTEAAAKNARPDAFALAAELAGAVDRLMQELGKRTERAGREPVVAEN
jgi:PAS domain S-box-containing protein